MVEKNFGRSVFICKLFFIILFIFILSIQVQAQVCPIKLTIHNAAIDPGDDNKFQVFLMGGVSCGNVEVIIEVTDPDNNIHEYHETTHTLGCGGNACTSWASYLTKFDNIPNTDISGRYYVKVTTPETWMQNDFIVNVVDCEREFFNDTELMAERQVTIESLPEMTKSDIVACCHHGCCYNLTLDIWDNKCDPVPAASNFPLAELNVGTTEPSSFGYTEICHRILPNTEIEYTSINASNYVIIGKNVERYKIINYTIVDVGKGACILPREDITTCKLTTKRLIINESVYRRHVFYNLSHPDPVCRGFYTPEIPWPYHRVQNTSRYFAVYGDLTDFFYCWMSLPLISDSKWCHLTNLAWYSVVNLTSERNVTYITPEAIEAENKWDNLSGYIVLGHACPLMRNYTEIVAPAATECFTATAGAFNIPCTHQFKTPCSPPGPALPNQCIYVWHSSVNGTIGYVKSFCYDGLGPNNGITLKVADNRTDTQIPAFNLTREEIQSIRSNVTLLNVHDQTPGCAPVLDGSYLFNYTNGTMAGDYRSCTKNDASYYRLFDENTTWVKIFAVTPMLEDELFLDWNWSRTSAPDNKVNATIYIGGGCKRTSAFYFNYAAGVDSYYETPIIDYVNVTVYDGQNPPVTYNVSGWNLLPFPPADSLVNISNGMVVDHHPYEGIRYSYFAINHTIPENAAYLHIEANYTCETTLERNTTAACGFMEKIYDKSTVYDNFTIEFLDHENPKDNCRWTNPLEWRNISGYWNRTWDATLGKHVLYLNKSPIVQNRRMVSVEPVQDGRVIEMLVKGNTSVGDIADATIGFYSNEDATKYWFLNLHEDSTGGKLAIGYWNGAVRNVRNSTPTSFVNDQWFWVRIFLDGGQIRAKLWSKGTKEPEGGWNISYLVGSIAGDPPILPGEYHLVIGAEDGQNLDEEFWFDPDPRCEINVSGCYDSELIPSIPVDIVTDGVIKIRIQPDILSGITLSVNGTPRVEYTHVTHPAKHSLYRKEKAAPSPPYPDTWEFYYTDKYGYESHMFGFNELCNLPPCPANCYCTEDSIFTPECIDPEDPTGFDYPDDCICVSDECIPDPCTSDRTYHEYEGKYYDFISFYNEMVPRRDSFSMVRDTDSNSWITAGGMSAIFDPGMVNSPQGTYKFNFSCHGINVTHFINEGRIIVYTHFRNFTYKVSDVLKRRAKSFISYTVNPAPDKIEPGDLVTINLNLTCGIFSNPNRNVEVIATNYEDELMGVSWIGDKAYVTTDSLGQASFSFVIREDTAEITLYYEGDYSGVSGCSPAQVDFLLGGEILGSIITSVEFFLLMIIFILAIFSYRWFKKGRLDFYEMLQEFRGEKD